MNTRTLRAIPAALLMTTAAAWSLPAAAESQTGTRLEASRLVSPVATSRPSSTVKVAQASGSTSSTPSNASAPSAPAVTGLPPAIVPAMPASTASGAKPATPKSNAPASTGAYGPSDAKQGTQAPKR